MGKLMTDRSPARDEARIEYSRSPIGCSTTAFASATLTPDEIIGNSSEIQALKRVIDRVAPSDVPVLINGETGTGKELFARRLHCVSRRNTHAFEAVNCAALPEGLLESELFGCEKGAFTGATTTRQGKLVHADHGTLFLDEIGDLSLNAQAKLLRALEQKEIQPVGSRTVRKVDFRLVAATNRNLQQMVTEEKFRSDLLFRLNTIQIYIPPLRERVSDIRLLAEHFLRMSSVAPGRVPIQLTETAQSFLSQQQWPGNARELRNTIDRVILLSDSITITGKDIALLFDVSTSPSKVPRKEPTGRIVAATKSLPRRERATIAPVLEVLVCGTTDLERLRSALELTNWNKSRAAELLCCSRMTVHRRLNRYRVAQSDKDVTERSVT